MSSILTSFLPTTILVVITYLANAFALNYMAVVIQVNLTVLLVWDLLYAQPILPGPFLMYCESISFNTIKHSGLAARSQAKS